MKTHSQENYHICPYPDCGKRYAHDYKLRNHIAAQHEKSPTDVPKYIPPQEKPVKAPKPSTGAHAAASSERPFVCPYEGCGKDYIHEYKLNLHLRTSHHQAEGNAKTAAQPNHAENELDEASDHDAYPGNQRGNGNGKNMKQQSRTKPNLKFPPSKIPRKKGTGFSPANLNVKKQQWTAKEEVYEEEDSEETEEDNDEGGWRNQETNGDDDEETEYED
ncbi:hypothetical protein Dimus_031282 [Dionaea muscipula]